MNKKAVLWLSSIMGLRFFGFFIVMPLLSVYALSLEGATTTLVGVVMGSYAMAQLLFQFPFGWAGDRFGRKGVIALGLALVVVGSVICVLATDIWWLIAGRALQGAGAINATISALISDFSREEERGKAMAMMGGAIALSFAISMVLGPIAGAAWGEEQLFWLIALLSALAIVILIVAVPKPPVIRHAVTEESHGIGRLLRDRNLSRMNLMIFFHAAFITTVFLVTPIAMVHHFGWAKDELWKAYLIALLLGIAAMGPAAVIGEKKDKIKAVFLVAILLMSLAFVLMAVAKSDWIFVSALALFFVGFNMQEPLLQSSVTKFARIHQRGTALGIFSTFQSLGAFVGGLAGGALLHALGLEGLAWLLAGLGLLWFGWTLSMENPTKKSFLYLHPDRFDLSLIHRFKEIHGVVEAWYNETEHLLIVKYDHRVIEGESLRERLERAYTKAL
ncbi:MAG: MFS transporter [Campylobacterales bacterium]